MQNGGEPATVLAPLVDDGAHKLIQKDSRELEASDIPDNSVHLVVTSPPYPKVRLWDQFFLSQGCSSFKEAHNYLEQVWRQCKRVLVDGGIACVNIGDATRTDETFRLFPNHSEVIGRFEKLRFQTLPYILWKKPTTKAKYKGKTVFFGSGFLPTNAYVTVDVEYILIFRKGGPRKFGPLDPTRYDSQYTKAQRDQWFSQIWTGITGARQTLGDSERRMAAYPDEIPRRLISMFSIKGDTIFDPFLGTGTTMRVAAELSRRCIGVEIDPSLHPVILHKIGYHDPESPVMIQGLAASSSRLSDIILR